MNFDAFKDTIVDGYQPNPLEIHDASIILENNFDRGLDVAKSAGFPKQDEFESASKGLDEVLVAVQTIVEKGDSEEYIHLVNYLHSYLIELQQVDVVTPIYLKIKRVVIECIHIVEKRFDKLETFDEIGPTIKLFDTLLERGYNLRPVASRFLDAHQDVLSDYSLFIYDGIFTEAFPLYTDLCLNRKNEQDAIFLANQLKNYSKQNTPPTKHYWEISQRLITEDKEFGLRILYELAVKPVLENDGIDLVDANEFLNEWYENAYTLPIQNSGRSVEKDFRKQIQHYVELERQRPGATKLLYERFGIRNFGRYPVSLLIDQVDNIDDIQSPYGVVIYPTTDYNGAFLDQDTAFASLEATSKSIGCRVRIFECNGVLGHKGINRALYNCNLWYGEASVSWVVLGGHGSPDSITIGRDKRDKSNNSISRDLFKNPRVSKIRNYLKPTANVLLVSCSTGVVDGISELISDRIDIPTIAPEKDSNVLMLTAGFTAQREYHITGLFQSSQEGVIIPRYIRFPKKDDTDALDEVTSVV